MAVNFNDLKEGQKIKYIGEAWNWGNDVHFNVNQEYQLYTLQSAYPTTKLEEPNALIIWCEEISVHRVQALNPDDWELVYEG